MEADVGQTEQAVLTNPPKQVVGPAGESCGLWGCGFGSDGTFITGAPGSTSNVPDEETTVSVITRWDEEGWYSTCILGCCYTRDGMGSCDRGGSLYCTEKRCDTVESFVP